MSEKYAPSGEHRGARSTGIVLRAYDAVYIPIPKVACTSLKTALAAVMGLSGDVHYEIDWPSVSLEDLEANHDGVTVFAFVRNPWDRLLSCFGSKIQPGRDDYYYRDGVEYNFWKYGDMFYGDMSFDAFVRATTSLPDSESDIHFSSQHRHLVDSSGSMFADFVGRFERLEADVVAVCQRIGATKIGVPHLYRTEHGHYSHYYSSTTRRLVEERWAEDIERFGYVFEPVG